MKSSSLLIILGVCILIILAYFLGQSSTGTIQYPIVSNMIPVDNSSIDQVPPTPTPTPTPTPSPIPTPQPSPNTGGTSLGQSFTLHKNETKKITGTNFQIGITEFFYSPCPVGTNCMWSGVGIGFEYHLGNETQKGIDLMEAFGYRVTVLKTDYITYALLRVDVAS